MPINFLKMHILLFFCTRWIEQNFLKSGNFLTPDISVQSFADALYMSHWSIHATQIAAMKWRSSLHYVLEEWIGATSYGKLNTQNIEKLGLAIASSIYVTLACLIILLEFCFLKHTHFASLFVPSQINSAKYMICCFKHTIENCKVILCTLSLT